MSEENEPTVGVQMYTAIKAAQQLVDVAASTLDTGARDPSQVELNESLDLLLGNMFIHLEGQGYTIEYKRG